MNITFTLQGTTPLLMHNPRMVDPNFEISREISAITSKRKRTEEDNAAIARLEWYGGLYTDQGVVTQPTSKVRKCLINTGRISKLGKAVERSLQMTSLHIPLVYDGPKDVDALWESGNYVSMLSVGLGTKRVMRCRPQFFPWALECEGIYFPDAGLKWDELQRLVELAGRVEGIGDGRAIGYGRFTASVEKVEG